MILKKIVWIFGDFLKLKLGKCFFQEQRNGDRIFFLSPIYFSQKEENFHKKCHWSCFILAARDDIKHIATVFQAVKTSC
jgi:hypothetical protein